MCAVLLPTAGSPFLNASAAPLATAPDLGDAESFAVLGHSTVTNAGPSSVTGDVGLWDGISITGLCTGVGCPGTVSGTIHPGDATAQDAQTAVTTAYNDLAGQTCVTNLSGQDLGGKVLTPGVYCFDSSAQLTGILHLDANDDPDPVWVFKIGSTLTTASNASVVFDNDGSSCDVFWQVVSSATLGTGTAFKGNILALESITVNTGANMSGSALARTGAVTMDTNTISICSGTTAIAMREFQATSAAGATCGLGAGAGLLLDLGLIVIRRRAPATREAMSSARQGQGKVMRVSI
jgi:hypothetical protein